MRLREAVARGPFVISIGSAIAISATSLPAQTVVQASVSSAGVPADQASGNVTTSSDGFRLAFVSAASNLVAGDGNGKEDVFVRDLASGLTWRVSVDSSGAEANGRSLTACIAGNGGFVAFESDATNLVANDTNGVNDVFVHDLTTGVTSRVSVSTTGIKGTTRARRLPYPMTDPGSHSQAVPQISAQLARTMVSFCATRLRGRLHSFASRHSIAVSPNPYYSLSQFQATDVSLRIELHLRGRTRP
ncbi:MAG: hypothetical protein IPK60_20665 [Sandaracinaceae bacterium]|nr:hypothetical protein [Sandaracinaceae bacterium]